MQLFHYVLPFTEVFHFPVSAHPWPPKSLNMHLGLTILYFTDSGLSETLYDNLQWVVDGNGGYRIDTGSWAVVEGCSYHTPKVAKMGVDGL